MTGAYCSLQLPTWRRHRKGSQTLPRGARDRTRSSRFKLQQGKFPLDTRKKKNLLRVVTHWNRCPETHLWKHPWRFWAGGWARWSPKFPLKGQHSVILHTALHQLSFRCPDMQHCTHPETVTRLTQVMCIDQYFVNPHIYRGLIYIHMHKNIPISICIYDIFHSN